MPYWGLWLPRQPLGVYLSFANVILFVFQTGYANALSVLNKPRSANESKNLYLGQLYELDSPKFSTGSRFRLKPLRMVYQGVEAG